MTTALAPARGIASVTADEHDGLLTVWVALDKRGTNMRAAENVARGYIRSEYGTAAVILYTGRYGTTIGGAHGFKFQGYTGH